MRTLAKTLRLSLPVGLLCLGWPAMSVAQEREALITQAFDEFDAARRVEILAQAVDPAAGPTDSLWTVGVQLLAESLLELNRESEAILWLRWAVRLAPDFQADPVQFLPGVVVAHRAALDFVGGSRTSDDDFAETTWRWRTTGEGVGIIQLATATLPSHTEALVEGRRIRAGGNLRLEPGSYRIELSAPGYKSAVVTREVLPGATTVLEVSLPPVLADEAEAENLARLARVTAWDDNRQNCRAGVVAGRDGLVLTTYGVLRGTDSVEVAAGGRRYDDDVRVAAYDVDRDVAVLKVPAQWTDSLTMARDVEDGQFAWTLHYPDCTAPAVTTLTRVAGWDNRPQGALRLDFPLPAAGRGAPLIDGTGAVVGLGDEANLAVPIWRAIAVLQEARRNVASGQLLLVIQVRQREEGIAPELVQTGGGFPTGWVLAGVGAAGAAAAVFALGGGGGGDGDGDGIGPCESETTGCIIITFPNP